MKIYINWQNGVFLLDLLVFLRLIQKFYWRLKEWFGAIFYLTSYLKQVIIIWALGEKKILYYLFILLYSSFASSPMPSFSLRINL